MMKKCLQVKNINTRIGKWKDLYQNVNEIKDNMIRELLPEIWKTKLR